MNCRPYMTLWSIWLLSMIAWSQSALCPDQHTQCGDDMTCCKWSSGNYGCCPLASAQCCADGLHCCPNGTKCNDKEGTCDALTEQTKRIALNLWPQIKSDSAGVCPDRNQTCLSDQTCCKEKGGGYGCCPYDSGVCCSDLLHCCPHGTRCDLIHKECVRQTNRLIDSNDSTNTPKERMRLIGFEAMNVTRIVCPGGRYVCPDNNTCCHTSASKWGCCPLLNAVCCKDGVHCCPSGTKCTSSGCQSL
ncbi:unnamed protein product [Medioppia subpectinata]|uniref:Granulins domain-containing protein n=1 Tax=Medioppia subpectinata TaxID=1979941 RepID=A0A7R9KV46_9ACAR|nr:unnamed protein product [Medioppia subpectinata]CAG2110257.1 unnamed protein product [Medioppia subpectinata]